MVTQARGKDMRGRKKRSHVSRWPDATQAQSETLGVMDWYGWRREWAINLLMLLCIVMFFQGIRGIFFVSSMYRVVRTMPAGVAGPTMLSRLNSFGVDVSELAKIAANGEVQGEVVYQDLADVSWDKRGSTLELSMLWTEDSKEMLAGLPTGYSEETFEISVVVPGQLKVSDQVRGALARRFVADISALDPNWRDPNVPSALPRGVASVLSNANAPDWKALRAIASDPAALTYRAASDSWVRVRPNMSYRYVELYTMAVIAPVVFVFALVKGIRAYKHWKRIQKGCEKCGYPVLFAGEPDQDGMLKPCSECGHDMNEVLARYRKKRESMGRLWKWVRQRKG